MNVTTREWGLGAATFVVVLLGATYWVGEPRVKELRDIERSRQGLVALRKSAEGLIARQGDVDQKLAELRKQLPEHPQGKDVTAETMMMLERKAQESGLTLLRRDPDKEKSVGDLYEVAIKCTWEGDLGAVVHFLYALQEQGAILDVSQLQMSPSQGGTDRLKGNFTVDCAYSRASGGLGGVQVQPVPAN